MTSNPPHTKTSSLHLGMSAVVGSLNDALGASTVADLAGAKDSKTPFRWAQTGGPTPRDTSARRLLFAYEQWTLLRTAIGAEAARLWFIAANPALSYETPVEAIRGDRFKETAKAAASLAG
ncbi:hypothetical protein BJ963_003538 [Leifsonia soli]|uniref:DUF2384 domain-containing protein n=1 Tax=Leifsonia soli TaxID=582665 RepID=A0A852T3E5_9MICO|nr:hypothetical protein [Leifsonia soli]